MPTVRKGQVVYWYECPGHADGRPAIVAAVGGETIDVNVVVEDSGTFLCRPGVRYCEDPNTEAINNAGAGVWGFMPSAPDAQTVKALEDLGGLVEQLHANNITLAKQHADLETRVAKLERKRGAAGGE